MSTRIAVIGGGSWGTAIAVNLTRNEQPVKFYLRREEQVESIKKNGVNRDYFPQHRLPEIIEPTSDLEQAVGDSDIVFISVPTSSTREILAELKLFLKTGAIIVSTAKGIEENSLLTNSEIIAEALSPEEKLAVLSGPTHSEEVMAGKPTAAVVASQEEQTARKIQRLMSNKTFRAYTNPDVVGVELGGAVKNIIAVAAGIAYGLDYGDNAVAALITRGLAEMSRYGRERGAKIFTFSGLAGLGDLVVTCNSTHSRNRTFGYKIGQGKSFARAEEEVGQVVEGIKTTRALYQALQEEQIKTEMPITEEIYQVLFAGKSPDRAVEDLMTRDPKREIEEVVSMNNWI